MKKTVDATRPVEKREALDQALAEAVLRLKNEPSQASACFSAMAEALCSAPDALTGRQLLKKLVATALSSWTPPTADPAAFAAAAADARFAVATYPAGKNPGPAVVRETSYTTTLGPDRPLLKGLARSFCSDVLVPARTHLRGLASQDDDIRALLEHLPRLMRSGSLEAPTAPRLPSHPRFPMDD